jgi:hypothetical protein
MRDKISVFYYPDFYTEFPTVKKSILLFDEIHFSDRPSFMFTMPGKEGDYRSPRPQFGTIGAQSPLRQYEQSFRENGVELYVHSPIDRPVEGKFLDYVRADINDLEFLYRFQDGLRKSERFRSIHITPGNYGEVGDHSAVLTKYLEIDLERDLPKGVNPMDLLMDPVGSKPYDFSTPESGLRTLLMAAAFCSVKINFALEIAKNDGFTPLADAAPYGHLIGTKYRRAINTLSQESGLGKIEITDLMFAVFDELVSAERLSKLTLGDIIRYRKESEKAREEFLEQLAVLHAKQAGIGPNGDYEETIKKLVLTEIVPAASTFKKKLETIYDNIFGSLMTSAVTYLGGGSAAVELFGHLNWQTLLPLAGVAGGKIAQEAIKAKLAIRAAKRECALSYLLDLEK